MTRRLPVPAPLEGYATRFDDLPRSRPTPLRLQTLPGGAAPRPAQQDLETALVNTEPVSGTQRKEAQSLQCFLSESGWDDREVNERRLELSFEGRSGRGWRFGNRRARGPQVG
jgi:hypothetical protein